MIKTNEDSRRIVKYSGYYFLAQFGKTEYFQKLLKVLESKNIYRIEEALIALLQILDDEESNHVDVYSHQIYPKIKLLDKSIELKFKHDKALLTKISKRDAYNDEGKKT